MRQSPHRALVIARTAILLSILVFPASMAHAQRGGRGGFGGGMAPTTIVPGPGQTIIWHGPTTSGWVQGPYRGHWYGGYYVYPDYSYGYSFYPACNPNFADPFGVLPFLMP
jgi:hypothetical protein